MKTEDGGYYGLKGYSFQYIYSMLKILDSEDENVDFDLEQVEDLGTKKELIQVKYKEKAKFQPSGIREPVLKLLKEMNSDERKLVLYCYFDDIENSKKINEQSIVLDSETKISVEYLDTILNKEKEGFSVLDKENFISKFSIIFTKTYDEKFFELINKIQTVYSCNEDTALVHYSCFMHHIMNKVVMNDTSNYEERKCSRKEFNILVESSKNTIINSHLEQIVGKEKYYSIIKKQLSFTKKPDNIEKIFVIDIDENEEIKNLVSIAIKIVSKFLIIKEYGNKKHVDSPAPYVYFRGANASQIVALKKQLHTNNYLLLDGYPFLGSDFSVSCITQRTSLKSDFKLKIINDNMCLRQILKEFEGINTELYELYLEEKQITDLNDSLFLNAIKVSQLSDITEYLLK